MDGYEIALTKKTNTAEKTKVKVPVYDTRYPSKTPVGLVDEIFVEDMSAMMKGKIDDALKGFKPEGGGGSVQVVQSTGDSTSAVMSQKAVTEELEYITNLAETSYSTVGTDSFPEFSTANNYKKGDVVQSDGKLYKFTNDYVSGESYFDEVVKRYLIAPVTKDLENRTTALEENLGLVSDSTFESLGDHNDRIEQNVERLTVVEANSGVNEYSLFDTAFSYSKGDILRMEDGSLIRLTADYVAGSGEPQYETWNLVLDTERSKTSANMGYVILRKGFSFAEQVTKENTIYEIRYDFDLGGETVTIPSGCALKFEGGVLKNGIVDFNHCIIYADNNVVIFNSIEISNLSIIHADWVDGSKDDLAKLLKIKGITLYIGKGSYNASVSKLVLEDIIIKGENKYDSKIYLKDSATNSAYLLGFGVNVELRDVTINNDCAYTGQVMRLSNEFLPVNMTKPHWVIDNINMVSAYSTSDYSGYKSTAIAIYCRDKDDDGKSIYNSVTSAYEHTNAVSYLRDFNNIYLQYYNVGIDVLIHQEDTSISKKIWCNSFLFNNLTIWATYGVRFMSATTDSDSGYFVFNNYLYQGKPNTYGYYTDDGKQCAITNYIPWDTQKIGYVASGELIVTGLINNHPYMFEGDGVVSSGHASRKLYVKGDGYVSSTGEGRFSIGSEELGQVEIRPDTNCKNKIVYNNKKGGVLNASLSHVDYNGNTPIKEKYNVYPGSSYGRDVTVVEHTEELWCSSDNSTYRTVIAAKPLITELAHVRQYQYNYISILSILGGFSIPPYSDCRMFFQAVDKDGNAVDLADNYSNVVVDVCANVEWRNNDKNVQIIGSRILKLSQSENESWIDVRNDSAETLTSFVVEFRIYGSGDEIMRSKVSKIPTGQQILHKYRGTYAEAIESSAYRKLGDVFFCTDRAIDGGETGIPIYNKGAGVWVDALGRIIS
jgi:hypothetical protein